MNVSKSFSSVKYLHCTKLKNVYYSYESAFKNEIILKQDLKIGTQRFT